MSVISYKLGCRNCLKSEGFNNFFSDYNEFGGKDPRQYSEFELMKIYEDWWGEDESTCSFCGSTNIEMYEIDIDNTPVYSFDKIVAKAIDNGHWVVDVNIDKNNNELGLKTGGYTHKITKLVYFQTIKLLKQYITSEVDVKFLAHEHGSFYICLNTSLNDNGEPVIKVERFRTTGIMKDEIFDLLDQLRDKVLFGG